MNIALNIYFQASSRNDKQLLKYKQRLYNVQCLASVKGPGAGGSTYFQSLESPFIKKQADFMHMYGIQVTNLQ